MSAICKVAFVALYSVLGTQPVCTDTGKHLKTSGTSLPDPSTADPRPGNSSDTLCVADAREMGRVQCALASSDVLGILRL